MTRRAFLKLAAWGAALFTLPPALIHSAASALSSDFPLTFPWTFSGASSHALPAGRLRSVVYLPLVQK